MALSTLHGTAGGGHIVSLTRKTGTAAKGAEQPVEQLAEQLRRHSSRCERSNSTAADVSMSDILRSASLPAPATRKGIQLHDATKTGDPGSHVPSKLPGGDSGLTTGVHHPSIRVGCQRLQLEQWKEWNKLNEQVEQLETTRN